MKYFSKNMNGPLSEGKFLFPIIFILINGSKKCIKSRLSYLYEIFCRVSKIVINTFSVIYIYIYIE